MKIVISGGTGFLGHALADRLTHDGHAVVLLTRGAASAGAAVQKVNWQPNGSVGVWASEVDGAGAVINLAGESIGNRRWSAQQKDRILDSRVRATRSLCEAIHRAATPPPVFISGSAVGYYGSRNDQIVTEDTPAGADFLAD